MRNTLSSRVLLQVISKDIESTLEKEREDIQRESELLLGKNRELTEQIIKLKETTDKERERISEKLILLEKQNKILNDEKNEFNRIKVNLEIEAERMEVENRQLTVNSHEASEELIRAKEHLMILNLESENKDNSIENLKSKIRDLEEELNLNVQNKTLSENRFWGFRCFSKESLTVNDLEGGYYSFYMQRQSLRKLQHKTDNFYKSKIKDKISKTEFSEFKTGKSSGSLKNNNYLENHVVPKISMFNSNEGRTKRHSDQLIPRKNTKLKPQIQTDKPKLSVTLSKTRIESLKSGSNKNNIDVKKSKFGKVIDSLDKKLQKIRIKMKKDSK